MTKRAILGSQYRVLIEFNVLKKKLSSKNMTEYINMEEKNVHEIISNMTQNDKPVRKTT